VLSAGTLTSPSKIAALTTAIQNSITLSAGWDITNFALQMQGLTSGAIQFGTVPTGPNEVIGGADVLGTSQSLITSYVNGLVNGAPLAGPPSYDGGKRVVTTTTAPPTTTTTTAPGTTSNAPITGDGIRCVN